MNIFKKGKKPASMPGSTADVATVSSEPEPKEELSMIPTKGRIVICKDFVQSNGETAHPAMITGFFGGADPNECKPGDPPPRVNLTVFPDQSGPRVASSVPMFADEESATHWQNAQGSIGPVCYWPPKVV